MRRQLLCGAAREKITPPTEWLPNLRGLMDSSFGGVVDDLYVRAIALQNGDTKILLVSFDLDKVPWPKQNMEAIEQHLQIPEDNILLVSIHTHSAPIAGDRTFEGPNDIAKKPLEVQEMTKRYEAFLTEKMLSAAKKAYDSLRPCRMRYGYGKSYININRLAVYEVREEDGSIHQELGTGMNYERETDRTLFAMTLEDLEGVPIAFFINYPVHNTVMILNACGKDGKVGITADMGGNVSKMLEKTYDGSIAMWTSGPAGDLNPIMSNQVYREDAQTGKPIEVYEKDGVIPLSMLRTLTAHHFADVQRTIRSLENIGECLDDVPLTAGVAWAQTPGRDEEGNDIPYKVRVHKIGIGPVLLFGFSGELYSGLGKRIREVVGVPNLVFLNHDASMIYNAGYIYGDDIFELWEKVGGDVVGIDHTWMLPGYIEPELTRCIKQLLSESEEEKL